MAGNVAEWTSTAYTEPGVLQANDINPDIQYNAAPEDPYALKKKSGSWWFVEGRECIHPFGCPDVRISE